MTGGSPLPGVQRMAVGGFHLLAFVKSGHGRLKLFPFGGTSDLNRGFECDMPIHVEFAF